MSNLPEKYQNFDISEFVIMKSSVLQSTLVTLELFVYCCVAAYNCERILKLPMPSYNHLICTKYKNSQFL